MSEPTATIDQIARDLGLTMLEALEAVTGLIERGAIIEAQPGRYRLATLTELEATELEAER